MSFITAVLRTTTHVCFPARSAFFILAVGFVASGARAANPEFSWVPVDASVPFTTAQPDLAGEDTEIILDTTGGQIVEFEIRVNGWGSAPGAPLLHIAQGTVDVAGFLGVNAIPANPGVDLSPLNNQAWRVNPGGNGRSDGAFISLQTCHDAGGTNVGPRCATYPTMTLEPCLLGTSCSDNDDFVFFGNLDAAGVLSIATANYAWGAVSVEAQCTPDTGGSYYLGTLVLNVPAGAVGTYTFGFDPDPTQTFLIDCPDAAFGNVILTPGHVTSRESGRCCTGSPLFTCEDYVLPEDCMGANQNFELGARCLDSPSCDCLPECAVDQDCDDNNMCTVDVCPVDTCTCQHIPTYNGIIECCDPRTGNITVIDDDDDCTADFCDVITGQVTHTAGCDDGDACTNDICLPDASCRNTVNYDPAKECCNPSSGVVSQIDDGEVCTDDACDPLTGQVGHVPVCPEFSWVPVDASVPFTTDRPDLAGADTRLIMSPSATNEIVEFEIRINGWNKVPGSRTLGLAQATLDTSGFLGVNALPANPGVDLSPLNNQAWRVNPGGNGKNDGAFITLQKCRAAPPVDVEPRCGTEPPMVFDPCPAGTICVDNDDFVFFWRLAIAATAVATPNYAWGAVSNIGDCTVDNGGSYYFGTLVLNVPAGAVGTYSFGFVPDPSWTFLADCSQAAFSNVILTPGQVTVATAEAPRTAPYPHDRRKNRYISFDPNKAVNDGSTIAFKVELKAITLGSCNGAAGDPPQVDFCREDRKRCSISGSSCSDDGDCDTGEGTCSVWSDCNTCVGAPAENACINQPIDCGTNGTCTPTGEICVNDAPIVGGSNVGRIWWVGPESPLGNSVHLMVSQPFRKVSTDWPNPTHVGDCEIVPEAVYGVRAVNVDTSAESDELVVETILRPMMSASWWGDCVGTLGIFCDGDIRRPQCVEVGDCPPGTATCERAWRLPDGAVNLDDINAALALVAPGPTSIPLDMTWVDLHGSASGTLGSQNFDPPNGALNFSDIGQIISGFGGFPYKGYDPADCPDEPDWPGV